MPTTTTATSKRLRNADARRMHACADDLYWQVFERLDGDPQLTGEDAGRIAHECAEVIRRRLRELWETD